MKKAQHLTQIEAVKHKFINGPHAILAWLGMLLGYKTIAECAQNPMLVAVSALYRTA
jgi:mannitol-1-phosphate/altronate dehydrogenase